MRCGFQRFAENFAEKEYKKKNSKNQQKQTSIFSLETIYFLRKTKNKYHKWPLGLSDCTSRSKPPETQNSAVCARGVGASKFPLEPDFPALLSTALSVPQSALGISCARRYHTNINAARCVQRNIYDKARVPLENGQEHGAEST